MELYLQIDENDDVRFLANDSDHEERMEHNRGDLMTPAFRESHCGTGETQETHYTNEETDKVAAFKEEEI